MSTPLEIPVYDALARRIGLILIPVFLIPVVAIFGIFSTIPANQKIPEDIALILGLLAVFSVGICLFMNASTNVRVKIDPGKGKVFRTYRLFGWTVRQQDYPLSQFERVSLHRGFRTGYIATLIGREKEVVLCFSTDLRRARKTAEDAAACCGLKLNDQL